MMFKIDSWINQTPEAIVLEKDNTISVEAHIHCHRLHWAGHVIRLENSRIPTKMIYVQWLSAMNHSINKEELQGLFKESVQPVMEVILIGRLLLLTDISGGLELMNALKSSKNLQ